MQKKGEVLEARLPLFGFKKRLSGSIVLYGSLDFKKKSPIYFNYSTIKKGSF